MCSRRLTPATWQAFDDRLRQLDVRKLETRSVQDACQVHDRVAALGQARERAGFAPVGLDHVHRGQQDEVLRALAPARGHGDARAARRQCGHQMAAHKSGSADDEEILLLHAFRAVLR